MRCDGQRWSSRSREGDQLASSNLLQRDLTLGDLLINKGHLVVLVDNSRINLAYNHFAQ